MTKGIDWPLVLGPLATSTDGLKADELSQLEQAIFQHSCRAVRGGCQLSSVEPVRSLPFETASVPWFPHRGHFVTDASIRPGAYLHHAVGDYYIQDAGSMLALAMCQVEPGQTICDTCASPGGKSTALLELLDGQGMLVVNEVIGSRLPILKLTLNRSGYANQCLMSLEIEQLAQVCQASFDCVLVDAPCTGQSMVARGKQSLAAFSAQQIEHSSARQRRIISAAARLVKPGGRLVYSTCAFSYAENEQVAQWFLEQTPEWEQLSFEQLKPWSSPLGDGGYRVWPHRDQCAGAFATALLRTGNHPWEASNPGMSRSRQPSWQSVAEPPEALAWYQENIPATWRLHQSELHRFPAFADQNWLDWSIAGTPIALYKSDRWEPLYGAARLQSNAAALGRSIELSDDQACRYVAGESIRVAKEGQGWHLVTWRLRRLAWGKLSQGSLKNHFPKPLRQSAIIA